MSKRKKTQESQPQQGTAGKKTSGSEPKAPKIFSSKNPVPLKEWLKGKNSPQE